MSVDSPLLGRGRMVKGRAGQRWGRERAKKIGGILQSLAPPCWNPPPTELGSPEVPSIGRGHSCISVQRAEPGFNGGGVGVGKQGKILQTQMLTGLARHVM